MIARLAFLGCLLAVGTLHAQVRVAAGAEGPLVVEGCTQPAVLYVPTDHRVGARMPLVLMMHGQGGAPTTWPWRQATRGKGYLVVGLSYAAMPGAGANGLDEASIKAMIAYIDRVRARIAADYGLAEDQVYLTGLSMGGWGVSYFGFHDASRGKYRGYGILAAGPLVEDGVDLSVARDRPVLVLNGETDPNLEAARLGAPELTKAGATVEVVVIPGEGHVPATGKMLAPLAAWLAKCGPQGAIPGQIAKARAFEDAGAKGKAIAAYEALLRAPASPEVVAALARAKALVANGERELERASAAARLGKRDEAGAMFRALAVAYEGHEIGTVATIELGLLEQAAAAARVRVEARGALDRAVALVAAKDYVAAHAALADVVARYAPSPAANEATAALARLEGDPAAATAIAAVCAGAKGEQLLALAETYVRDRKPDHAKVALRELVVKHVGTPLAARAQALLEGLE